MRCRLRCCLRLWLRLSLRLRLRGRSNSRCRFRLRCGRCRLLFCRNLAIVNDRCLVGHHCGRNIVDHFFRENLHDFTFNQSFNVQIERNSIDDAVGIDAVIADVVRFSPKFDHWRQNIDLAIDHRCHGS